MRSFEYAAPRTLDEAVEALATSQGPARPLAGGTDLIVQLREGRRTVARVVDLTRVPTLTGLDFDTDGTLRLGAATPCAAVYAHERVRREHAILVDAASMIGSVQIQNRASIGGNLCNAAPSGDCIPPLICSGAQAVIAGPQGRRTLPVEDFCTGPGQTVLEPGELLAELRLPPPLPHSGGHYLRFIPRNEMDIAVAGAGVLLRVDPASGRCTHARIALSAVAPTPLRVPEAEHALIGTDLGREDVERAARLAAAGARPISDVRGSADYRRHLVFVLTFRAVGEAMRRAGVAPDFPLRGGIALAG